MSVVSHRTKRMKEPIRMPPGRSMRRPARMRIARRKSSVSEDVTMAKGNSQGIPISS